MTRHVSLSVCFVATGLFLMACDADSEGNAQVADEDSQTSQLDMIGDFSSDSDRESANGNEVSDYVDIADLAVIGTGTADMNGESNRHEDLLNRAEALNDRQEQMLNRVDVLYDREEALIKRAAALLDQWEEQAERQDRILDVMEEQHGLK